MKNNNSNKQNPIQENKPSNEQKAPGKPESKVRTGDEKEIMNDSIIVNKALSGNKSGGVKKQDPADEGQDLDDSVENK